MNDMLIRAIVCNIPDARELVSEIVGKVKIVSLTDDEVERMIKIREALKDA